MEKLTLNECVEVFGTSPQIMDKNSRLNEALLRLIELAKTGQGKHPHFGKIGKDKVTGFTGIVIGVSSYTTGCNQFLIQPQCKEDDPSTAPDGKWIDEGRLDMEETVIVAPEDITDEEYPGCDISAPTK